MRARVIFVVLLGLACKGPQPLQAQQMRPAVVSDPPIDQKFPPGLAAITVPSHGVDMDATFYLAAGAGPQGKHPPSPRFRLCPGDFLIPVASVGVLRPEPGDAARHWAT